MFAGVGSVWGMGESVSDGGVPGSDSSFWSVFVRVEMSVLE